MGTIRVLDPTSVERTLEIMSLGGRSRIVANCSTLFTEWPLFERPAVAAAYGFEAVEFWWPWESVSSPSSREIDLFIDAVQSSSVRLAAMNLYAGDMRAGQRGVLSHPAEAGALRDSARAASVIAHALGTRLFNVLYGLGDSGNRAMERQTALANLTEIGHLFEPFDGEILIEPLSGLAAYPLRHASDVLHLIAEARTMGVNRIGALLDVYHLHSNGEDLASAIRLLNTSIAHVQFADAPGRHEAGTGQIDFPRVLAELDRVQYSGHIALEYLPQADTASSLRKWRWLDNAME